MFNTRCLTRDVDTRAFLVYNLKVKIVKLIIQGKRKDGENRMASKKVEKETPKKAVNKVFYSIGTTCGKVKSTAKKLYKTTAPGTTAEGSGTVKDNLAEAVRDLKETAGTIKRSFMAGFNCATAGSKCGQAGPSGSDAAMKGKRGRKPGVKKSKTEDAAVKEAAVGPSGESGIVEESVGSAQELKKDTHTQ